MQYVVLVMIFYLKKKIFRDFFSSDIRLELQIEHATYRVLKCSIAFALFAHSTCPSRVSLLFAPSGVNCVSLASALIGIAASNLAPILKIEFFTFFFI